MLGEILRSALAAVCALFRSRTKLLADNVILRQQIIVLKRVTPKPRFKTRDRLAFAVMTKLFPTILSAVTLVRPETVIRWHRSIWRLIWRRRSCGPVGRPVVDADTRALIRRMWTDNPLWGENRIAAELGKLDPRVSHRTVAKYRPRYLLRNRGQKWSTFIRNHLHHTWVLKSTFSSYTRGISGRN